MARGKFFPVVEASPDGPDDLETDDIKPQVIGIRIDFQDEKDDADRGRSSSLDETEELVGSNVEDLHTDKELSPLNGRRKTVGSEDQDLHTDKELSPLNGRRKTVGSEDQEMECLNACEEDGTPSKTRGAMTTFAATTNLITCMIGASVLSLPRMVANSGWVMGPLMLVLAGGVSCRASLLVNRALEVVTELRGIGLAPRNVGEVVEICFGLRGKAIVLTLTCLFQVAKCGVYFVVIGTNLHFWSDSLTSKQCTLVAVAFGIWLVFVRSITTISKWSIIGVAASVCYLLSIGTAGFEAVATLPAESRQSDLWPVKVGNLPQTFAVMLYAYSPADVLPVMKADMQRPEELPKAVIRSHLATASAYVILAAVGYYGWGVHVAGNVLESMCDLPGCHGTIPDHQAPGTKWMSGYVLATAVVANLMVTIPIVMYCVFCTVEAQLDVLKVSCVANVAMRTVIVLGSVSIALFVPFFIEILAVISTALLISLQILLPCLVTWALSREGKVKFGVPEGSLLTLGLIVMVVGLSSALHNLVDAIHAAS